MIDRGPNQQLFDFWSFTQSRPKKMQLLDVQNINIHILYTLCYTIYSLMDLFINCIQLYFVCFLLMFIHVFFGPIYGTY